MATTDHDTPSAVTLEHAYRIERGLICITHAARAIDEYADGASVDQIVSIAHLIAREGELLQEAYEPIHSLIRDDERTAPEFREGAVLPSPGKNEQSAAARPAEIDQLRARVAALGYRLVTCPGLLESDGETPYTGLYILDPKTDELVIISAGGADEDPFEIEGWLEKREADTVDVSSRKADHPNPAVELGLEIHGNSGEYRLHYGRFTRKFESLDELQEWVRSEGAEGGAS